MGKLRHARTHTAAPELLRIGRLKQLRLRGNQRQQPLLQHLCWDGPNGSSRTEALS